ncbi:hypothetical protein CPHLJ_3g1680 [Cryptosporidium parvum]
MNQILLKYTSVFFLLIAFFDQLVELNDLTATFKDISFVRLSAVYYGNFHEKIEVLETDIENPPQLDLSEMAYTEEVDIISHSMAESLIDRFKIPDCKLNILYKAVNTLLHSMFLFEKQKCILQLLKTKYRKRKCDSLPRIISVSLSCRRIMKQIENLEKSLEKLTEQIKKLERYILNCFLSAIKMLWKEGREQSFEIDEEAAKECDYKELYLIWQEQQLLKKYKTLLNSFTTSSFGKKASRSSNTSCFCRKTQSAKCKKYAFKRFLLTLEKVEAKIKSLTVEFVSCASYLTLNGISNNEAEPTNENRPASLIGSLGELLS